MPPKKNGATKSDAETINYAIGDVVLGKVRGYPSWPGWIVDPDKAASDVQRERPGKKQGVYCVQFFPTADHAWLDRKSISRLQTDEIEKYIKDPQKNKGELLAGYKIALNPSAWDQERVDSRADDGEDDEEDADGEDDDEVPKAKASKKRKRDSEVKAKAPAKKAKAKKETSAEPKKKAGKKGVKSKTTVESEDEGADDEDKPVTKKSKKAAAKEDEENSELAKNPDAVKVREWRHRLQKTFLPGNKIPPREEDMGAADELFKSVESYDGMTIEYLSFSKIGKVMRHIQALEDERLPRDAEFNFRSRAKNMVDKWQGMTAPSSNGAAAPASDAAAISAAPALVEDTKMDEAKDTAEEVPKTNGNGNAEEKPMSAEPDATTEAPADADADQSVLADVTMTDAGDA